MRHNLSRNTSQYYAEISRASLVSDAEEERRLIKRWQECKDVKARDAIIQTHLRFVITLARKRTRDPDRLQDLIAAGNIGLFKALDKYDLNRKPVVRFLTYAGWWVQKEIADEDYSTASLVRIPTHRQKAQRKHARAFQKALQANGPDARPAPPEGPEGIAIAFEALRPSDETFCVPAHHVEVNGTDHLVRRAISTLPLREQTVLNLYFGTKDEPRNHAQIAAILGMSPERVRQIKIEGIDQLRTVLARCSVTSLSDAY